MGVAREISKYKLDFVGEQEVRWDRGGTGVIVTLCMHFSTQYLLEQNFFKLEL
jgi:hypothetical protein